MTGSTHRFLRFDTESLPIYSAEGRYREVLGAIDALAEGVFV